MNWNARSIGAPPVFYILTEMWEIYHRAIIVIVGFIMNKDNYKAVMKHKHSG